MVVQEATISEEVRVTTFSEEVLGLIILTVEVATMKY
jgi:hypothetical protein